MCDFPLTFEHDRTFDHYGNWEETGIYREKLREYTQRLAQLQAVLFNYVHGLRIPLESIDERPIEECFP